jgi:two-component system sensor histidine kinase MprB
VSAWVHRRSFQGRLTTLVAVAVGFAVVLAGLAAYVLVARQLHNQIDQQLNADWTRIQSTQGSGIDQKIALNVASQENAFVEFYLPQFGVQHLPGVTSGREIGLTKRQEAVVGTQDSPLISTVSSGGADYRTLTVPVSLNGQPAALEIGQTLSSVNNTLNTLRLILYLVGIAGIALAVVFGLLISRLTLRPVKRLTAAAEHVAATQELDSTIEVEGDDELGRLAESFNEMLRALSSSRRQQAQLVSDAGHELRTPLTSLRTNVELMMRAKQLPEADQRELYGDITAQVEELTTLIGDLVEMARQEEQQPEPVEVRLDTIVEHAIQRARRRAPSLRFDVELTPGSVRAQPPLLERAVLNVMDNAAKWSPPGGTVEVRLTRGETWLLEVRDHGPGIAPEDQLKVFDRFYRAPTARAMPGSGLGLAIVSQVVRTHGGEVSIESATGGGTVVHMRLPIVTEQEPTPVGPSAFGPLPVGLPPPPPSPPPVPFAPAGLSPGSDPASP